MENNHVNKKITKLSSTNLQIIYGLFSLVGVIATWYFNIPMIIANDGFSLALFISDNYINDSSASIMNDIAVVGSVFIVWSFVESRRLSIPYWWFYAITTFCIALAFAFPLFLLFRERKLEAMRKAELGL
jgi:hypothetical protein